MENPMVLRPNEFSIPVTMEVDMGDPNTGVDMVDSVVSGFDDDLLRGSPHRSADIRSHLNDLARRHPDLADQLRGFPGEGVYSESKPHEAASGSSSEQQGTAQESAQQQQQQQDGEKQDCKIGNLQNHGLRNTVPLVSPMNPTDPNSSRSPRAQSAPPQSNEDPAGTGGPRFVSKIEIQPNHNQAPAGGGPQQEMSEMYIPTGPGAVPQNNENQAPPHGQPQPHNNNNNTNQQQFHSHHPEPTKTPHVKQPNVRHIPIFVEGRDAPIVNRDHEPTSFHHQESAHPPTYHEPPHPHSNRYREPIFEPVFSTANNVPLDRPFGGSHHPSGGVAFDIPVQTGGGNYSRGPSQFGGSGFSKPQQRPAPSEKVHRVFTQGSEPPPAQRTQAHHQQSHAPPSHHQGVHPTDTVDSGPGAPAAPHAPSPPPKKMSRPKTSLEIIQEVQSEVDKLKEEIEKYKGTSRSDKEYIYLDEMLTRELLKLDNVDSGGVEEIRNLRRTTIKNIQATIASLEAKVPSTPAGAESEAPSSENGQAGGDAPAGESQMEVDSKSGGEESAQPAAESGASGAGEKKDAGEGTPAPPTPGAGGEPAPAGGEQK
ncbi:hypothetical protein M8J77_003280 [Diaphorina citri]|nr:hypothetical protein M8J77_003280 [Diaphorina citri]